MMESAVSIVDARHMGDAEIASYTDWLGNSEMARYRSFVRHERQRQFVIGRVLLRHELGKLFRVPARSIKLIERPGDAPLLDLPGTQQVGFSLSHSGNWVACAVSASTPVGLDIEVIDPGRNIEALSQQAFSVQQAAWLASRPAQTRLRDFYEMWCAHEARIKLRAEDGHSYVLPHPAVAAVLCSARPLVAPPELSSASLQLLSI